MAIDPDVRIKFAQFFRKHYKLILFIVLAIILIILINMYLVLYGGNDTPSTTYAPTVSVLDSSSEVPTKVASTFEEFIEDYMNYLNAADYVSAYNMISEDCRVNYFNNSYNEYVEYITSKYDTTKSYAIQDYSNYNGGYIYSVKLYNNFLATGLTNQSYRYIEEKMLVYYDDNGDIQINVANYMGSQDVQYQASNDYLKAEITKETAKYSFVLYTVKLTNRSNYTIVLQDGNADGTEIYINIGDETRAYTENIDIVLEPGETKTVTLSFSKFYDSDIEVKSLVFNSVRVMENYTGNEETAEEEIENAIYKASMTISMQ